MEEKKSMKNQENKSKPSIQITKISAFEDEFEERKKRKSISVSHLGQRRFSGSRVVLDNTFFQEKDLKSPPKNKNTNSRFPDEKQSTLLKDVFSKYPTIDEQESKEESMGQTSSDMQQVKMNEMFYKTQQNEKLKLKPSTNINKRFKSKMLSLFD